MLTPLPKIILNNRMRWNYRQNVALHQAFGNLRDNHSVSLSGNASPSLLHSWNAWLVKKGVQKGRHAFWKGVMEYTIERFECTWVFLELKSRYISLFATADGHSINDMVVAPAMLASSTDFEHHLFRSIISKASFVQQRQ